MSSASSSTLSDSATSPNTYVSRGPTMSTALVPVPLHCNSFPKHGTLVPNRVFIGGLAASVTEDELGSLFARYGNVRTVKIIVDRVGLSKGYGFVTFDNEEESQVIVLKDRKLNVAPAVRKQGIGRSLESLTSPLSPAYPAYYNSMPYLHPVTSPAVSPSVASSPSVSVVNTPTTPSVLPSVPAQPDVQIAATPSSSGGASAVPPLAVPPGDVNMAAAYYATPAGPARSTPYPYLYAPPVYFQQYPYTAPQWAPGTQWQWLSSYRQASPVTQYVYFGNALPGTAVVGDPGTGQAAFVTPSPSSPAVGHTYTNVIPVEQSHEGANVVSGSNNNQAGDQGLAEPSTLYSHNRQYYLHASEPLLTAPRAALCTPPSVSVFTAPNAPPRRASSQRWSHEATQWNDVPWNGGGGGNGGGVRLRDFSPDCDRRRRQASDSYSWTQYRHSSDQLAGLGSISSPRLCPAKKLVFSPASSHSSLNLSLNETLSCPEQGSTSNNPPLNHHCAIQSKRRLVLDQQSPSRLNRDRHLASSSPGACLSQVSRVPITPPATPVDSNDIAKQMRL